MTEEVSLCLYICFVKQDVASQCKHQTFSLKKLGHEMKLTGAKAGSILNSLK